MGNGILRLVRDDLTTLDLDAFVYYARHDLVLGSGWGNAISARGGASIQEELNKYGPIQTGEVVRSGAGDLKARYILHAVGPRFQERDLAQKLRKTMQCCLAAARDAGLSTLGFPTMGAGYYGIPLDLCATVMVEEIELHLAGETSLTEVVICVQDAREREVFEQRNREVQPN